MASVSASHLIIFVASIVIAAGVVGTLTTGVERVSSSIDDGSLDVSQQISMDMAIISDPKNPSSNGNDELVIHVRNTGSQPVPIDNDGSAFDVVLNGNFISPIDVEDVNDDTESVWRPGNVVEITIEYDDEVNNEGDNRLFLTVFGDEELFEFRGDDL